MNRAADYIMAVVIILAEGLCGIILWMLLVDVPELRQTATWAELGWLKYVAAGEAWIVIIGLIVACIFFPYLAYLVLHD